MVASQVNTILQLMEMVSMVQQDNKTIMSCFDTLTEQIAALLSAQTPSNTQSPARAHWGESSYVPWWLCAARKKVRPTFTSVVLRKWNHPLELPSHLWKKGQCTMGAQTSGETEWKKQCMTLRLAFQNVGGFLQDKEMAVKMEIVWWTVMDREIDILGFTESNTCWDLLPDNLRLATHMRGWWETSQWSLTNNRTKKESIHQPRGTSILYVNQVAHHTLQLGDDPLGLGCWCWTKLWGPNEFYLWIITMYQLCFSNRPLTTYQQQARGLAKRGCFECPQDAILKDTSEEILKW